jgi:thioredoxin-like negative regulator of GroEL
MELSALTNSTQLQEALAQAGNKTVVVDFTATWCGPCKKIAPVLHGLASKHSDTFRVFTADVDVAVDLVRHFKVSSMPTFIFFRGNRVIYVLKGASTELLTQAFEIIDAMTSK